MLPNHFIQSLNILRYVKLADPAFQRSYATLVCIYVLMIHKRVTGNYYDEISGYLSYQNNS